MDMEDRIRNIKEGALFPYVPNIKLYKCPAGVRGEVCTYAIPDYMNGHDAIPDYTPDPLINRNKIRNSAQQIDSFKFYYSALCGRMVGPDYSQTR